MNIPIIGQPGIKDWFVTVNVICPCGQALLLVGKPQQAMTACACGAAYAMLGMPTLTPEGRINLPLGVGRVKQENPSNEK